MFKAKSSEFFLVQKFATLWSFMTPHLHGLSGKLFLVLACVGHYVNDVTHKAWRGKTTWRDQCQWSVAGLRQRSFTEQQGGCAESNDHRRATGRAGGDRDMARRSSVFIAEACYCTWLPFHWASGRAAGDRDMTWRTSVFVTEACYCTWLPFHWASGRAGGDSDMTWRTSVFVTEACYSTWLPFHLASGRAGCDRDMAWRTSVFVTEACYSTWLPFHWASGRAGGDSDMIWRTSVFITEACYSTWLPFHWRCKTDRTDCSCQHRRVQKLRWFSHSVKRSSQASKNSPWR